MALVNSLDSARNLVSLVPRLRQKVHSCTTASRAEWCACVRTWWRWTAGQRGLHGNQARWRSSSRILSVIKMNDMKKKKMNNPTNNKTNKTRSNEWTKCPHHLSMDHIYAIRRCLFDWLIDWLIDWLTDWLTDWLADWLIDWLLTMGLPCTAP